MMKHVIVAGVIAATLACGSAQAGDRLGAVLGGVAVGAVGGVLLGSALSAQARPRPVYVQPAPPPTVEYVEPAPRRVVAVRSSFDDQAYSLHERCDDGDRRACIRFGIVIGQHRERVADWRRSHPDYFSYED